jgi:hypothetical protein|tara:strand:- start:1187 stop:2137 length:951 start_codon:yes stop_codon:yes gene_type:complete
MAIVANTFTGYSAVGIREELSNIIQNISPEQTPFISNVGSENVTNTYFEWQEDSLSAVQTTAQIDGDDVTAFDATAATTRKGNYTQILRRTTIVADNLADQDTAGRTNELSYQLAKRGKEIRRDLEATMLLNNASVAGAAATARETGGLGAWIATNENVGTGGGLTTGDGTTARTDGTQRAFTETILKDAMQQAFVSGGEPSILMVGPVNKQTVSGFAGVAAQRYQAPSDSPTTIIGAADVYLSDFGTLNVVPNRFQRERDGWLLDPEYASVAYLRPIQQVELAKTGDAEKSMILVEAGLKVSNEAAHAICADLTT